MDKHRKRELLSQLIKSKKWEQVLVFTRTKHGGNKLTKQNVAEDYVRRIGRTGRAGQSGEAASLVCVDEHKLLRDIEKFTNQKIKKIEIEAFRPDPDIKAEPIQNGRGGAQRRGRSSRHA